MSRRIPVTFGQNNRLVSVDFDDFDKTKEAVRQKWKLSGDFVLQAPYGSKGDTMNVEIVDGDDLSAVREADFLVVHLSPDVAAGAAAKPDAVLPPPRFLHDKGVQTGADFYHHTYTYKNTEYDFYTPPGPESQVVLDQQERLAEEMNVPKLVDEMQRIPDYLRLAYFGVLGNQELCKKIRKMQFDVMELIKQCDVAAIQLQIKASGLTETVQYGFEFLLVGKKNFALEYFKNVDVISEEMLEKIKTMKAQVEAKKREIEEILKGVTVSARTVSERRAETMKIDIQTDSEGMLQMALRGAEAGVKSLLRELIPNIEFWLFLSVECDSIAHTETAARLKEAASPTERKKREFWTSPTFKRQVLNFLARWVALRKVCQDFQQGTDRLEEGILQCIQEDPTVDEARRRVKDLLAEDEARMRRKMEALIKAPR